MLEFTNGDIFLAIVAGIILSLIYTEVTGVLPAGLVVPGYIAVLFKDPINIVVIFLIAFLTYLIVMRVVAKFTILYGRRKFAAMLTVAIILKLTTDFIFHNIFTAEMVGGLILVGVIVPGLIANTIQKQGVLPTTISTLLLSGLTFSVTAIGSIIH